MDLVLFFDGCHKIYYAEAGDTKTIAQMNEYGYDTIKPEKFGKELRELWASSCSLRFVQHAAFDPKAPQVYQFQKGGLGRIISDLKQWLVFQENSRTFNDSIKLSDIKLKEEQ